MRTHLKSGSKKCYKAVFDFQFCPQGMDHSDALWDKSPSEKCTLMLRRRASWCLLWGFSPNRPQCSNRPPEAINHQSNHCYLSTNQTNVVFRPIHPNKQNQLIQLIFPLSCLWLHSPLQYSTSRSRFKFIHSFHFLSHQLYPRLSSSFLCFCFPAKRCFFCYFAFLTNTIN